MGSLTYELIKEKTKGKELDSIKKLNCWASNLKDISIIRELTNLEVLTLSVNKIVTLKYIQHCKHLTELYIRNNSISNLNEIFYLKELKCLKILWLADNECSRDPLYNSLYRLTVIRNLPYLKKLDNSNVTQDEIINSKISGLIIDKPLKERGNQGASSYGKNSSINLECFSELYNQKINERYQSNRTDFVVKNEMERCENSSIQNKKIQEIDGDIETYNSKTTNGELKQTSNILQAVFLLINNLNENEARSVIEACAKRIESLCESNVDK